MVKLFAMSVLYKGPSDATLLKSAFDLQSFGYFQRKSVQEFMGFVTKTIVERTASAARQSVKEKVFKRFIPWRNIIYFNCILTFVEYMCHVYVRADNLAGVLISDDEYPHRVAHTLLTKALDEFSAKVPSHNWPKLNETQVQFNELNAMLAKYQNPKEADAMTRIQQDLDDTKIILHNTIEAVLERGEKLDELVSKSEDLSMQSKAFYKTAKKTNACCRM